MTPTIKVETWTFYERAIALPVPQINQENRLDRIGCCHKGWHRYLNDCGGLVCQDCGKVAG